jgi:hypothetical protein
LGALAAHPIKRQFQERIRQKEKKKDKKEEEIGAYDRLQVPVHSLGGYLHQEHWLCTQ